MTALVLAPNEEWMDDAACKDVGHEPFFPPDGVKTAEITRQANAAFGRSICEKCSVRVECLDYQLRYERRVGHTSPGIFGGMTEAERRNLRMRDGGRGRPL